MRERGIGAALALEQVPRASSRSRTCGIGKRSGLEPNGLRGDWNVRRMKRARSLLRRAFLPESRFPQCLVLCYHRVADVATDPSSLCVSRRHFAEHLDCLRRHCHPMSLQGLVEALSAGEVPRRGVVVTFDDGYADNLYNARPLLERYGVPGTVFVITGQIGSEREFWWDDLDRLLLQPGKLPEILRLSANGDEWEWDLGEASRYGEESFRRHQSWTIQEESDPGPRQALYRSLRQLLRGLPHDERRRVIDELVEWAGAGSVGRPTHRALSPDEVVRLDAGELVEIGAHTVTHPVLSALPIGTQRDEIRGSKARLEGILGHPVTAFAYPYGWRTDFTAETVAVVREAGFACACATSACTVRDYGDRFLLPRTVVRDWDGEEFLCRLEECFRD